MRHDSSAKVEPHGFAAIWNLEKKNKTSGTQDKYQGTYVRSDNGDADENVPQNKGKQNLNQLTPNLE